MIGLAIVFVGDRAAAEDIVQDAFAGLFRHERGLSDASAAGGYLVRSVINGCRSHGRRSRTAANHKPEAPLAAASAESIVEGRSETDRITEAVRALPDQQRIAIVCRYFLDLDRSQTADAMGVSVNSVKTHLRRATRALASTLEEEG
jgi:RNA polymerase sigma factor (sigma-70 family)